SLLFGCGKATMTSEDLIEKTSVIVMVDHETILADETLWRITDKTKIRTQTGKRLTNEDLKAGDLISYVNDGHIGESYPSQGTLKKVTLFKDENSIKLSSAILSFLENQPLGDLVKFEMLSIDGNELTARIKIWDLEVDDQLLVQLNLETNKFTIVQE
ncbi:hypothetical protein J4G37_43665, partial [Microvirga sp. 3-52]|nr:hypothetical protein [Microvirga sp. 3-52]